MGSHYIPVGKLKIDKDLLDIACPAAGYDSTPPPPAIYCPSNGYIPDPELFFPPYPLPETTEESITFICNATIANWRCATNRYKFNKINSDPYFYELFDNIGNLIDSWTSSLEYMDFDFPTNDRYYTVKVSLPSPSYFTQFFNNDSIYASHDDCIEAMIVNCPTGFTHFNMRGNNNITNVVFTEATLLNVLSFAYAFSGCRNIRYFVPKWPAMPTLQFTFEMFSNSGLIKADLRGLNAINLNLTDSMFLGCKYLDEIIFPSNWSGKRIHSMVKNTIRLRRVVMPETWISNDDTHPNLMNNFFSNSGVEGEVIFNEILGMDSWKNVAEKCPNLEVLRIKGAYTGLGTTAFQYCIYGCSSIRIFEAPRSVGNTVYSGSPFDSNSVLLEEYIGPDVGYIGVPVANSPLKSITGEHDNSANASYPSQVTIPTGSTVRANLATLQMPKLRVMRFLCGTTSSTKFTALNSLEIDWANSTWSSTTSPQLSISAAIDATEINRIFTALPMVTGKTVDVRYCDGYATCDPSIATAKGWTVL